MVEIKLIIKVDMIKLTTLYMTVILEYNYSEHTLTACDLTIYGGASCLCIFKLASSLTLCILIVVAIFNALKNKENGFFTSQELASLLSFFSLPP